MPGLGSPGKDDNHGDCGLCRRQARNFVSIFRLRKTEMPIGTVAAEDVNRHPLNPLNTGSSNLAVSFPRDTCR